jgi:N-acetyl-beta-hexosaminidase
MYMLLKKYVKGRNTQKFVFDEKDKTIRSVHKKYYAMTIQSYGHNVNLVFTSGAKINSRWY